MQPGPRYQSGSLSAVVGLIFNLCATAAAAQQAAQVLLHSGVVSIVRLQGPAGLANAGSVLGPGDTVRTEAGSTARLRFADGTEVSLRPRSALRIDAFAYREAAPLDDRMHLRLLQGGLRGTPGRIGTRSPAAYRLVAGDTTLAPRDADVLVRVCAADCAGEERALRAAVVPPAPGARVGAVGGGLSALRPDGRWRALDAGDPVFSGDALVTGASGVAVLFFLDDTRITLQPRSILVIDDYQYGSAAPQGNRAVLLLLDGAARTQTGAIAKDDPERFVFLTPGRRIRVHGTLFDTVVAAATGVAGQAQDAAQQAGQAASTAAGQAGDAAQTAAAEVTLGLQTASTRIDQAQQVASNTIARGGQAGDEVIDTASSGPSPTGNGPGEVWREMQSGISDAFSTAQDDTTRWVQRTATWGGGKIAGAIDTGQTVGENIAAGGGRVVELAYGAAGTVVTVGRDGVDAASSVPGDVARAVARGLAATLPAIIGVVRDAGAATDVDDRANSAIGNIRESTDRAVAVGVGVVVGAVRATQEAAVGGAGGDQGVTAVQVHDGAVSVADGRAEIRIPRGMLVVDLGDGTQQVRFDGVIANPFPNPASFKVDAAFLGTTMGDTVAGGVYTAVRDGKVAVTTAGKGIVLGAGETGYADGQGGAPTRLRDVAHFMGGDVYIAVAADGGQSCRRDAGARTWGLVATAAARDTRGAAQGGRFNADDLKTTALPGVRSAGASRGTDAGFGVRGLADAGRRGVPGEPSGGFAGGNNPRNAASNIEGASTWSGGQRYGGTFGGERLFGRSGDIAIGAGDGMGNFRGSGRGNSVSGANGKGGRIIDVLTTPGDGAPVSIPYPGADGSAPSAGGTAVKPPSSGFRITSGDEAGTAAGMISSTEGAGGQAAFTAAQSWLGATQRIAYDGRALVQKMAAAAKPGAVRRERDDDLGSGSPFIVLNRADAGQMANAIRRQIAAATGGAGGAGDGRTDQQTTTGGGPAMVDRDTQAGANLRTGAAGTLNLDLVLRINQLVNPPSQ